MDEKILSRKAAGSNPPGHDIFCTPENSDFISTHPYQDLSATEREIRLLKVLPDSGSGFVECELLPGVKLADVHKQYVALSYCAGSAKNTGSIKVNGTRCNVFANLHHALMEARHYWQTQANQQEFLLWADQICINQSNLAERSHQVGFMRDIYANAEQTLVCLSTPEAHGEGMRWLIELVDNAAQPLSCNGTDHISGKKLWEYINGLDDSIDVFTSPWWGRAWVFQEFMVSAQIIFLYGRHFMPYPEFERLTSNIISDDKYDDELKCLRPQLYEPERLIEMNRAVSQMERFLQAKKERSTIRTSDLTDLLLTTKDCQASDARDKLYSVLGLANSGYGIVPDYSRENDIDNLLVETTKRLIIFEGNLEVLLYKSCCNPLGPSTRGPLPSWVLDWTNSANLVIPFRCRCRFMPASPDVSFLQVPHPQHPGEQITALQVWAVLIDTGFRKEMGANCTGFVGAKEYSFWHDNEFVIESDHELWIIRGSPEPLLLKKYSYGYGVVTPVDGTGLDIKLKERVPGIVNDRGEFDMSKMQETRITLL